VPPTPAQIADHQRRRAYALVRFTDRHPVINPQRGVGDQAMAGSPRASRRRDGMCAVRPPSTVMT
jgi:hypothetical protein